MDIDTQTWPSDDEQRDELEFDDDPPAAPVSLTDTQRAELVGALERSLAEGGCDNTLRRAERWARAARVPWPLLRRQLEYNGGYCDCEVLYNVFPEEDVEWG